MALIRIRVPDPLCLRVRKLASERRIEEPDMWRAVIERGLMLEEADVAFGSLANDVNAKIATVLLEEMSRVREGLKREVLGDLTRIVVENLCLNRRMAGALPAGGDDLIRRAKEDARAILEQLEIQ